MDTVRSRPGVKVAVVAFAVIAMYAMAGCGGSQTTVTRTGNTTETVTQTDTVAIALITATTAVLSALLTGLATHFAASRRDKKQATRDEATGRDLQTREAISATSSAVGDVMAIAHRHSGLAADGGNLESAEIYEAGYREVQAIRDAALPKVYLLEDVDLREKAVKVLDLYGAWLHDSSEAFVNEVPQPPTEAAFGARDAYFARAREVLAESASRVNSTLN